MPLVVQPAWLAQVQEEVIDPSRRIVDPHHHFFVKNPEFPYYTLEDLWTDMTPHGVEQTVFLQCWEGHRESGPEHLQPVGETEWVHEIAERAKRSPDKTQIGAIIGTADFLLGAKVREVLEAHVAASPRFRGIRQIAAWDPHPEFLSAPWASNGNLYGDLKFRAGFAVLAEMKLVCDAYHYHHQTPYLVDLARAFPNTQIVLDHLGTPLGTHAYAGRAEEIFAAWKRDLAVLASCPNVNVKLGGLAMPWNGFGFENDPRPPTSDELAARQDRYYHYAIDAFGPARCMFESNFPVDKVSVSYTVLWNAFKKMAARYTEAEKDLMFSGTASRVYGLTKLR